MYDYTHYHYYYYYYYYILAIIIAIGCIIIIINFRASGITLGAAPRAGRRDRPLPPNKILLYGDFIINSPTLISNKREFQTQP